jgi:peptidoglycan/xylan/chitin deacetylase (PgdA/CDA1 family)
MNLRVFILCILTGLGCSTPRGYEGCSQFKCDHGAIVRGDTTMKEIALVFTGHEFADGGDDIRSILSKAGIKASFFFTGDFYRNPEFRLLVGSLKSDGHYLGAHSDKHLLYCDWNNRDSLLVSKDEFTRDLRTNYEAMRQHGIGNPPYFLPPYEWHNDSISAWTRTMDLQLVNMTHGTLSHADYTTPDLPSYRSNDVIYSSIVDYEQRADSGLNGFILLSHIGTSSLRTEKFHSRLTELLVQLNERGYSFKRIDQLLGNPDSDEK